MTASHGLDGLGVHGGETVLVHGAGSTVGYATVQMAIQRGARVIATAGKTYAAALRAAGAEVTDYGDSVVER
jgi:NADPH:quinone reductase-like Zn-dependent oxidoreductase